MGGNQSMEDERINRSSSLSSNHRHHGRGRRDRISRRHERRIQLGVLGDAGTSEFMKWFANSSKDGEKDDTKVENDSSSSRSRVSEYRKISNQGIDSRISTYRRVVEQNLTIAQKEIMLSKQGCTVILTNNCGVDKDDTIPRSFYKKSHGFILIYDVCNFDSFNFVGNFISEIEMYTQHGTSVSMILVGVRTSNEKGREIPLSEAEAYAKKRGIAFYEVGYKDEQGVIDVAVLDVATDCCTKNRFDVKPHSRYNQGNSVACLGICGVG